MEQKWEPETITLKDRFMEDDGEPTGDGCINICNNRGPIGLTVPENEYPRGTTFTVRITYQAHPPKDIG
jgi:hypothetical protein